MKQFQHFLIFFICSVLGSLATYAAPFIWEHHNLGMDIPPGGTLTYYTTQRLEIQWEDQVLTAQSYSKYLRSGKEASKTLLMQNLRRMASDYNMYDLKEVKIKCKGFKTYAIEGTLPNGARGILAYYAAKKNDLLVEVAVNYLYGFRQQVDDLLRSFTLGHPKPVPADPKQKIQTREEAEQQRKEQIQKVKKRNTRIYEI